MCCVSTVTKWHCNSVTDVVQSSIFPLGGCNDSNAANLDVPEVTDNEKPLCVIQDLNYITFAHAFTTYDLAVKICPITEPVLNKRNT